MTDRQRQMIAGYLPNPRDPELGPMEYYVEDARGRAVRVHVGSIGYSGEEAIYQVMTDSGRLVHGPWETQPDLFGGGWYTMANLYDNKEDCIHSEHCMYSGWEDLRKLQEAERKGEAE